MSARRASSLAVVSVVAGVLLVVVLSAWAASIGPSGVLRGDGPSPAAPASPTATASESASPGPDPEPAYAAEPGDAPPWIRAFALLVNLGVIVGLVVLAARFGAVPLVRSTRRRRAARRRRTPERLEFDVLEPSAAVAREILTDAGAQRRLLAEDADPRNAVVACWGRFETQAAAAGLARAPWETSAEYTMRVLDLVDADQPAVSRLGELYREARFSAHPVTETHRREALAALDTIHRTLRLPAGAGA